MQRAVRSLSAFFPLVLALGLCVVDTIAAQAADPLPASVAISNSSNDVPIFIAEKNGYFADEGLAVTTIPFNSGAVMMAPMAVGDLDVGLGPATAELYNAVARGISIKIVSGNGNAPPGYDHSILLVRKDLTNRSD